MSQTAHRVAISNRRLVALADGSVTFRWRDSAHKNKKRLMTLPVNEFLRRFLLHVLPPGFVRIRHFGFLAHRRRGTSLPLWFQLLAESGSVRAASRARENDSSSSPPSRGPGGAVCQEDETQVWSLPLVLEQLRAFPSGIKIAC